MSTIQFMRCSRFMLRPLSSKGLEPQRISSTACRRFPRWDHQSIRRIVGRGEEPAAICGRGFWLFPLRSLWQGVAGPCQRPRRCYWCWALPGCGESVARFSTCVKEFPSGVGGSSFLHRTAGGLGVACGSYTTHLLRIGDVCAPQPCHTPHDVRSPAMVNILAYQHKSLWHA